MRMRTLGATGMQVSTYCLGTMMFGPLGNDDRDACVGIVHAALDAGINFVDTADVYSQGESERIVGEALKGHRDEVVLATKFYNRMGEGPNRRGGSRRWIVQAVEDSLRRLGTDRIDLYQMHRPDHDTDIDETLAALSDLMRQGKVLAIGSSTFPAERIVEAQWTAERRSRERFTCEQPPYSLFVRGIERAVLPTCERYGMGVLAWSPLNSGWLTGRYRLGQELELSSGQPARIPARFDPNDPANAAKLERVERLIEVADDVGCSLTHLAMAFVVSHPAITSAIIGPRTMEQFQDVMAGADVVLDDAALDRIDEIVTPGVDMNAPIDAGYAPPELGDASRRRRPAVERAAA